MDRPRHVTRAPGKPVMLFDGDCGFCLFWIRRWQRITGDATDYIPLQDEHVPALYPELGRQGLEEAVHFIDAAGAVHRGAEAVFRSLALNPGWRWLLRLYEGFPPLARASEGAYRLVAEHRTFFSRLTRLLWGPHVERADHRLVRRLFLTCLGLIYLIAFVSLWTQLGGLIGKNGILPAAEFMSQVRHAVDADGIGLGRYRVAPTLCWFGASDGVLRFQCGAGSVLALLLVAGVAPRACLALMWLLYLSLATVSGEFLSFQWDNLLLEAGLLAIFFAPRGLLPRRARELAPSRTVLWLLRLLLFKLMFLSGVVKLASGDSTWRNLTALTYHYETQPLPTWTAWYASQLPLWFQKMSCVVMFAIELGAPFLILAPRRARMAGAGALAIFQVLILLTGNYTFFNCLALALCLVLLDDFALARVLPRKLAGSCSRPAEGPAPDLGPVPRWRKALTTALAIVVVSISIVQLLAPLGWLPGWSAPVVAMDRWLAPLRSINNYGLFAVMTTRRQEIIVEGSNDGHDWKAYEFPYKPGDLTRRPAFVAPYQPRLDWQMWFAALGDYREDPWFVNFCLRLLQGSPEVLALLANNPFPERPPVYIRAQLYDYHFTTPEERRRTGAWWKREFSRPYLPPVSLRPTEPQHGASPTLFSSLSSALSLKMAASRHQG